MTQELSPTSSNGSWRARHVSNPACLKGASSGPLPSPNTSSQEAGLYSALRRSGGRKGSFSKQYIHGSLLISGDRNTSGDSAVSVSGIFSGTDKLAPLSLPPSDHQVSGTTAGTPPPVAINSRRGSGGAAANFSLTPPLSLSQFKKKTGRSPPSSLHFSSGMIAKDSTPEQYKSRTSPRGIGHYSKPASSPRELSEKLSTLTSPRANIPEQYGSPRSKTLPHMQDRTESSKPQGSPRDVANVDVFKFQYTPRKYHTCSPGMDALFTTQSNKLQSNIPASIDSEIDQKEESSSYNVNPILSANDQTQPMHVAQMQHQQHLISQQLLVEHQKTQHAQTFVHNHQHQHLPLSVQQYHTQHQHTNQNQQTEYVQHQQTYYHQQQHQAHTHALHNEQSPRRAAEQYLLTHGLEAQTMHQQQPTAMKPPAYQIIEPTTLQDLPTKSEGFSQVSVNHGTDFALRQEQYELLLQYQQSQVQSKAQHQLQQHQLHFKQLVHHHQNKQDTQLTSTQHESSPHEVMKDMQKAQNEKLHVSPTQTCHSYRFNRNHSDFFYKFHPFLTFRIFRNYSNFFPN